jgi:hypothetical protein
VLEGFSCTIFAYGQTSTGKTYTMEGARDDITNKIKDEHAGVIPRSVAHIFRTLDQSKTEYTIKLSCLELYNEELQDLLAPESEKNVQNHRQLKIYEDGRGTYVKGAEEVIVSDPDSVMLILDEAAKKRQIAETQLNKKSSRSHAITTITIHIRDTTDDGEEYIRTGKLNMVDLAGSENIGRSGAQNKRAKEAGMINQSLLTLGRVITALTEKCPHIPYRESKLTRLLQDSLGGRTKTCIIATVSPSVLCLEETLSTLDYANRAKSIKNKPELNVKVPKSAMIKEMVGEMEVLKQQLYMQRAKQGGVWMSETDYIKSESEKRELKDKIDILMMEVTQSKQLFEDAKFTIEEVNERLRVEKAEHENTRSELETTNTLLMQKERQIYDLEERITEMKFVLTHKESAEKQLHTDANILLNNLKQSENDITLLCDNIGRQRDIHGHNQESVSSCTDNITQQVTQLVDSFAEFKQKYTQVAETNFKKYIEDFATERTHIVNDLIEKHTQQLLEQYTVTREKINSLMEQHLNTSKSDVSQAQQSQKNFQKAVTELIKVHNEVIESTLTTVRSEVSTQFETGVQWLSDYVKKDIVAGTHGIVINFGEQHSALLSEALKKVNENTSAQLKVLEQYRQTFIALVSEHRASNVHMKQSIMSKVEQIVDECVSANQDKFKSNVSDVGKGLEHISGQVEIFRRDFIGDNEEMNKHFNTFSSDIERAHENYITTVDKSYERVSQMRDATLRNVEEASILMTNQSGNVLQRVENFISDSRTLLEKQDKDVKHLRLDTQLVAEKHTKLFEGELQSTRNRINHFNNGIITPFVTNVTETNLNGQSIFESMNTTGFKVSSNTRSSVLRLRENWRENNNCGNTPPRKRKRTTVDSIAAIRTYDEIARERIQQQQASLPSSTESSDNECDNMEDQENVPLSPNSLKGNIIIGTVPQQNITTKVAKKLTLDTVAINNNITTKPIIEKTSVTFSPRDGKRRKKVLTTSTATINRLAKNKSNNMRSDSSSNFR